MEFFDSLCPLNASPWAESNFTVATTLLRTSLQYCCSIACWVASSTSIRLFCAKLSNPCILSNSIQFNSGIYRRRLHAWPAAYSKFKINISFNFTRVASKCWKEKSTFQEPCLYVDSTVFSRIGDHRHFMILGFFMRCEFGRNILPMSAYD